MFAICLVFSIKWKIFMSMYCHHKATCIGFMSVCPLIYLLSCFPFAFMSLSGRYQFQHSNTKARWNNTIWNTLEMKIQKKKTQSFHCEQRATTKSVIFCLCVSYFEFHEKYPNCYVKSLIKLFQMSERIPFPSKA